jgi:hypothetical protein
MNFFAGQSKPFPEHSKEREFLVSTVNALKHRFRSEIEIFENPDAKEMILAHPMCPFRNLTFFGECEVERKWYYIAGNGPIYLGGSQIILLEK